MVLGYLGNIPFFIFEKDRPEVDAISSYQAIKWSLQIKCLPFSKGF